MPPFGTVARRSTATMIQDPTVGLRNAMAAVDLYPGDFVWDGAFHRFPGAGKKKSNKSGWYKAFPDRKGAVFGDFSTGIEVNWQADRSSEPTKSMRAEWAAEDAKRKKARAEAEARAIEEVQKVWDNAIQTPAAEVLGHPYLKKKEIESCERLRISVKTELDGWTLPAGILLIPMLVNKKVVNLQRITRDGQKLYWPKAPASGASLIIGGKYYREDTTKTIYVAEGWATAWTVSEATKCPCMVAFSKDGLLPVAKKVKKRFAGVSVVIAADNDRWTVVKQKEGLPDIPNPGVHYAKLAAEEAGCEVAIPDFHDLSNKPTDFDDLRRLKGIDAVTSWLDPENASSARTVADPESATDRPTPGARDLGDDQHSDSDPDAESAEHGAKRDDALKFVRKLIADGNYEKARQELDALDSEETDSPPTNLENDLEEATTPKDLRRILDREDPGGSLPVCRDWTGEPERREWLAPLWFPAGRVALLAADGGSAKSLFALQVAAVVAAGEGFQAPGSKGPAMLPGNKRADGKAPQLAGKAGVVVFVTWEDEPDEVHRRLSGLPNLFDGRTVRDAVEDRLHLMDLAGCGALWGPADDGHRDTVARLTDTGRALEAYVRHVKPRLIVIDPVAAAYGGNENDRGAVRGFLSHLNALAAETGAAVLLVAHPPKGRNADHYSGSTDWRNGVRVMVILGPQPVRNYVGKPKNGNSNAPAEGQALTLEKANYARPGRTAWLRFKVDDGPNGPQGPPAIMAWEEVSALDAAEAYHKWQKWDPPQERKPKKKASRRKKEPKKERAEEETEEKSSTTSAGNRSEKAADGQPVL